MSDLYERLRRIREQRHGQGERTVRDLSPGAGWDRVAPGVYRRERELAIPATLDEQICAEGRWETLSPVMQTGSVSITPVFLDVETSGLSAGAGSVAFLVGLGRLVRNGSGGAVQVEQFFLSDLGAEPDFTTRLHQSINTLSADAQIEHSPLAYVTYNGASFDLPVLRTRAVMVRRRFPERIHLDLLPLVRRLYAPVIGSCRLSAVEQFVLRTTRHNDLPGSEVPERYLAFIRTGEMKPLTPVLDHHFYDIAHLAILGLHVNALFLQFSRSESTTPAMTIPIPLRGDSGRGDDSGGGDDSGRGNQACGPGVGAEGDDSGRGNQARGPAVGADEAAFLRLLLERGDPTDRIKAERRIEFLLHRDENGHGWLALARLHAGIVRRRRDWNELVLVLARIWERDGILVDAIDLAIQLEHRRRDYPAALMIVRAAAARYGWDVVLRHREARLQRKLTAAGR